MILIYREIFSDLPVTVNWCLSFYIDKCTNTSYINITRKYLAVTNKRKFEKQILDSYVGEESDGKS